MPKFIVWRLWSIYFDHQLSLKPSIGKQRKQSCTPNIICRVSFNCLIRFFLRFTHSYARSFGTLSDNRIGEKYVDIMTFSDWSLQSSFSSASTFSAYRKQRYEFRSPARPDIRACFAIFVGIASLLIFVSLIWCDLTVSTSAYYFRKPEPLIKKKEKRGRICVG